MAGATVRVTLGDFVIGSEKGSSGLVNMEDGATIVCNSSLNVGHEGTGALIVGEGCVVQNDEDAYVGENLTGVGTITVSGAGAKWQSNNPMRIGYSGRGLLNVENQGAVVANEGCIIANDGTTPYSYVIVSGQGSSFKVNSLPLIVGSGQSGVLDVANGASVTCEALTMGVFSASTDSRVNVFGSAATLSCNGDITVGEEGTGHISASSSGIITCDNLWIGQATLQNDDNSVTLDGSGTKLTSHVLIRVLNSASFTIENKANAVSISGNIDGGTLSSPTQVVIDGAKSSWTLSDFLRVGPSSEGNRLTIKNGASLSCSELIVGAMNEDASGTVVLTDNALLVGSKTLSIGGNSGDSMVSVNNGSLLVTGNAVTMENDGSIRLANGYWAIKGVATAKSVTQSFNVMVFDGNAWVRANTSNVSVTYFASSEAWKSSGLYATFGTNVDLTGYTVVSGGSGIAYAPAWLDAVEDNATWHLSSWYGWVNISGEKADGWVYHANHGWQYVYDLGNDAGIVFWDMGSDCWWFTSKDFYPDMYNMNTSSWYFYYVGGITPNRWFYDYADHGAVKEAVEFSH